MKIIIEDFQNAAFVYEGKKYTVKTAKIVRNKAVIITDHKTFVYTESELENFYDDVSFSAVEVGVVAAQSTVVNAEVVQVNSLSNRIMTKLEMMFDELSTSPSEENYKKAKSMVDTSNAMMNVVAQNYKYLSLNK